jgi:hypothetical protein
MNTSLFLHTIWASILVLGWIRVACIVISIAALARIHAWWGVLGLVIFVAYLLHLL